MARTEIPVDQNRLRSAILDAEKSGPLENQSVVFVKAAEIYNKDLKGFKPIEPGVVRLRVVKWSIPIITPSGKGRGKREMSDAHKAALNASRGQRKSRAEKFAGDPSIQENIQTLRAHVSHESPVHLPLVDAIEKGSMRAAVKLNCLRCMGYESATTQIRNCTSKTCAMYAFRPYKQGQTDEEADAADTASAETTTEAA